MSKASSSPAPARDTRVEILDAALELFAAQGFHGTGLRDIARAVGIRESAIYYHFEGKEALFEALLTEAPADAPAHIRDARPDPVPPDLAPLFERLLSGLLDRSGTLRERKRFRILLSDGLRLAVEGKIQLIDRLGGAARAEMIGLMQHLIDAGRLQGDAEHLALSFMAPVVLWRHQQELQPTHRFVTQSKVFVRMHVQQFLAGAVEPRSRR